MIKLGDICTVVSGTTPKSNKPEYWDGNINWVTPAELTDDSDVIFESQRKITEKAIVDCSLKPFPAGTVLLSSRAPIGKVAIAGVEMYCNQGFKNLICSDKIYNRYLYYYLKYKTDYLNSLGRGATFKEISKSIVENIEIPLPPLDEQRKIAAMLDKVSDLIAKHRQQLDKLDELVKSRFIEMFGDPLGNSKEWPCVSVSNVCRSILGGGTPAKGQQEYFTGTIPWVTPKDMKSSTISDSIDHITEEAIAHSSTNLVPENSVLMVIRSGILKHTLPVAINRVPVTINQDMKAFVPNEIIKATFMMYFFKMIEQDVLSGVRSVTADNIDFKAFSKRMIIVPPLELQQQFAAFVEQTDKSKLAIKQSLEKLETLKKSLLQKYFG